MKIRVRFSKVGKVRFVSHRDVARIWERGLRRAALPVAYSQGFSPHPKLSFGLALPTGAESLGEYLDIELDAGSGTGGRPLAAGFDPEEFLGRIDGCLPVGLSAQAATEIEPGTLSLQQAVTSCTWRIEVGGPGAGALASHIARVLAAGSLVVTRERKGQPVTDDVRPAVLAAAVVEGPVVPPPPGEHEYRLPAGPVVEAELATQPRALRPSELIALLGDGLTEERTCRHHQWTFAPGGARREPLPLPAPPPAAPRTELRAS